MSSVLASGKFSIAHVNGSSVALLARNDCGRRPNGCRPRRTNGEGLDSRGVANSECSQERSALVRGVGEATVIVPETGTDWAVPLINFYIL